MMQVFLHKSARAHIILSDMCTNTHYYNAIALRFVNLVHKIYKSRKF